MLFRSKLLENMVEELGLFGIPRTYQQPLDLSLIHIFDIFSYLCTMKKDEIIVLLKEQLQLANEQLQQANATVSSLSQVSGVQSSGCPSTNELPQPKWSYMMTALPDSATLSNSSK